MRRDPPAFPGIGAKTTTYFNSSSCKLGGATARTDTAEQPEQFVIYQTSAARPIDAVRMLGTGRWSWLAASCLVVSATAEESPRCVLSATHATGPPYVGTGTLKVPPAWLADLVEFGHWLGTKTPW